MNKKELLDNLEALGYALVRTDDVHVYDVLKELLSQDDVRLLEGFPTVLANAFDRKLISLEDLWLFFLNSPQESFFISMSVVSIVLYDDVGFTSDWLNVFRQKFEIKRAQSLPQYKEAISNGTILKVEGQAISGERLKKSFQQYYRQQDETLQIKQKNYENLALHQALSEIFSARQKDIVLKKLNARPLSKTEQEYFSRVIKKKLIAVGNDELHTLAKKVLAI